MGDNYSAVLISFFATWDNSDDNLLVFAINVLCVFCKTNLNIETQNCPIIRPTQ